MALQIVAAADPADLADQAGAFLLTRIERALKERGRARIILAGGSTPRATYAVLAAGAARRALRLERLSWFFGDERWVGAADAESNEGMARAALLGPLRAPEDSIHSWQAGRGDPVDCAAAYGEVVTREMGGADHASDRAPDILILGMGADGHTASLFPGATAHLPGGKTVPVSAALPGSAAAIGPEGQRGWRLTLCPDFLRTSRCVVFLVTGAEKAAAFRRATRGDPSTPATWVRGGETVFIATRDVVEDGGRDIRHA